MTILLLCFLIISTSLAKIYNTFGIRFSEDILKKYFVDSFNSIFNKMNYHELYDVTEKVTLLPLKGDITLSMIVSKTQIKDPIKEDSVRYNQESITCTKDIFFMTGEISSKWSLKIKGVQIFYGDIIVSTNITLTGFTFKLSDPPSYKIEFNVKSFKHTIHGFGACEYIASKIKSIIDKKVSKQLEDILDGYKDSIIMKIQYEEAFRNIQIRDPDGIITNFNLQNRKAEFDTTLMNGYIGITYYTVIFDEVTNNITNLNETFSPNDEVSYPISVYFGQSNIKNVYKILNTTLIEKIKLIDQNQQEKIFGYPITIESLLNYYPNLFEKYPHDIELDLLCSIKSIKNEIIEIGRAHV